MTKEIMSLKIGNNLGFPEGIVFSGELDVGGGNDCGGVGLSRHGENTTLVDLRL